MEQLGLRLRAIKVKLAYFGEEQDTISLETSPKTPRHRTDRINHL